MQIVSLVARMVGSKLLVGLLPLLYSRISMTVGSHSVHILFRVRVFVQIFF